jgi:anti-sigma regulatory factor (Ser/Thr protein kinase)
MNAKSGYNIVSMSHQNLIVEQWWRSHPGNVQQAREAARSVILKYDAAEADLLELAIGEACANAVEHGSPGGEANSFCLRCYVDPNHSTLIFEVEDEGRDFCLTDLSLSRTPDLYSENGRGLFLINAIMDDVALRSTPRGLNVRMSKIVSEKTALH